MVDNVFGDLAKGQGHCGEDEEAGDKLQSEKTLGVRFLLHECL